jgi:hypothetical protein
MDLREQDGMVWTRLIWLRIGDSEWQALVNMIMMIRVHKMLKNSWATERLVASQGIKFMELLVSN